MERHGNKSPTKGRLHATCQPTACAGFQFVAEITVEHEETAPDPGVGPGEVFTQEQAAQIRAAVATLPYEQRQAIELAFLGGLTQHEIADSLRQPLGTIKARIRRGMLKLRDSLRPLL